MAVVSVFSVHRADMYSLQMTFHHAFYPDRPSETKLTLRPSMSLPKISLHKFCVVEHFSA